MPRQRCHSVVACHSTVREKQRPEAEMQSGEEQCYNREDRRLVCGTGRRCHAAPPNRSRNAGRRRSALYRAFAQVGGGVEVARMRERQRHTVPAHSVSPPAPKCCRASASVTRRFTALWWCRRRGGGGISTGWQYTLAKRYEW